VKFPQIRQIVRCPANRGDSAYTGRITHVGADVQTNISGIRFVWVTVRRSDADRSAVWPSHRLGFKIN